jgi:hypothetical protein
MAAVRALAAFALLLFGALAWYLAPLEPSVLALQFQFTPKSYGYVIHAWSEADLRRYRGHFAADYVLLAAYGALGWLVAMRSASFRALPAALRRSARWWLPLAAAFDAIENALHLWLTAVPRFGVPWAYAVAASCSVAKWALLFAFALLALWALARAGATADVRS